MFVDCITIASLTFLAPKRSREGQVVGHRAVWRQKCAACVLWSGREQIALRIRSPPRARSDLTALFGAKKRGTRYTRTRAIFFSFDTNSSFVLSFVRRGHGDYMQRKQRPHRSRTVHCSAIKERSPARNCNVLYTRRCLPFIAIGRDFFALHTVATLA